MRERDLGAGHPDLAWGLTVLSEQALAAGDAEEAVALAGRAAAILDAVPEPNSRALATVLLLQGSGLTAQGRDADALPFYRRALALGPAGSDTATRVVAHLQVANAYESQGNLSAAETELRSTLELLRRERGESDPQAARVLFRLAQVEAAAGNARAAEGLYRQVVAAYGVNGRADAELSLARANLAAARASGGDLVGASELFSEAVPAPHEKLGGDDARVARAAAGWASIHDQLGRMEHAEGHHGEAVAHYRRSLAIREQWGDAADPQMAVTLHSLGVLNHTSQNFADAEVAYLRALDIVGHDDDRAGRLLHDLGLVYATQGEFERAEPAFRNSLAILERSLGADDPTVKRARDDLAQVRSVLTQMREATAQPAAGTTRP